MRFNGTYITSARNRERERAMKGEGEFRKRIFLRWQ